MQLSITITDQSRPGVELTSLPPMHAGETLKIGFATWLNPDGTTRNMSGASVALKLYKLPARDLITITGATVTTSLSSVIGYTELLERAGSLNDLQKDFLSRIQGSVQQITALINDLLDIGSIEAGFDTRREYIQLEGILRYTLDMLQGQIKSKRIIIKTEIAPGLPALRANPIRLRRVMDNVVGNAIKYSYPEGEIYISIRAEGDGLILQVKDAGPGIPVADQPRIFDKFYRGSNIAEVEGSGLGLAIVKTIVTSRWSSASPVPCATAPH